MYRVLVIGLGLAAMGAIGWTASTARPLPDSATAGLTGDPAAGETVFIAAGCASCHMAPGAEGDAELVLAGGQRFPSPFGTFVAPNISPDPEHGIGGWTLTDLASALTKGVSPEGEHYYPAFPYSAYSKMALQDVADLKAYLDTLPADATANQPHEIGFPFNIRRSLFGWKLLYLSRHWVVPVDGNPELERGRYLVEALAHCGECHTPRTALGGLATNRWMAGAPDPSGKGSAPNITPAVLDWSPVDVAYYLETGFTPEFDSVGGHMAHVVTNMSKLSPEDRAAIAAYLAVLSPVAPRD